ncbi:MULTISPECIES: ComEA family DNA-binding protein [Vibrio]|jgi:competence protein ComEA|uniref:ComEA family DNA-binding protein n=2 Tax=Vibrio TaxID=662 RepID=A0ABW7J6Y7_9VIBR|nr:MULTISPECIES: helix-hairpin-helix domain-containing protein [Vibrio]KIP70409.1 transporter [Vibrio harveyi]KIP77644.1 transporter [Vibrio harveyi]PAW10719.1 transporter [Vibrio sp. V1B]PMO37362.1 transporter [Vibrio sp. 10N.222.52.B12]PQJ52163.1 transporter [Vibrio jasicida]
MKWMLTLCLMLLAPVGWAAGGETTKSKSSKYEGIEITVNVNTASAEEIATLLNGIGEKKAEQIVEYREEHGPFKTAADLSKVKGIGEATVKKNQERILL